MSDPVAPVDTLANLCRQARHLLLRVHESRWPGFPAASNEEPSPGGSPEKRHRPAPAPATSARPVARVNAPSAPVSAPLAAPVAPAAPEPIAGSPAPREAYGTFASLEEIARAVAVCTRCRLHESRMKAVPGEGDPHAALVFVGEGPGADEDRLGRPFVGRAGQLLDRMIVAMGLLREQVFIANVVKCRPPGNRDPFPDEIAACQPYLHAQLDLIRPQAICALGKFSAQTLLATKAPISALRGNFRDYRGIPLMPTFHPSYLLRSREEAKDKELVWKDLQQILVRLGLPIPAAKGKKNQS